MGSKYVDYLKNKYGNINTISNIQMANCRYYITAETEKAGKVYFKTGGGEEDYKYSPESTDWNEHIYGGLEEKRFYTEPHVPTISETKPYYSEAKKLFKKYGKLLSINITDHWKYYVNAEIIVEKRDHPIKVRLSASYDRYCKINTFDVSWDRLVERDCDHTYVYETESSDESNGSSDSGESDELNE